MEMFNRIFNKVLRMLNYSLRKLPEDNSNANDLGSLSMYASESAQIKLHFDCGPRILKGWVNIDLCFEPFEPYLESYTNDHYPVALRGTRDDLFIVNIINDGLPLPDHSVDLIFHEDFFEHLTQKEQIVFLAETLRVMKPGSVHRINTPNLVVSMLDNSSFSKGKDGVFTAEWDNWHHHNVITPTILEEMATMVGYSEIIFNSKNQSTAAHLLPPEYRPNEKDRPSANSNVFADLIK